MSREILSKAMSETISGQDLGDARVFFEKELQQLMQQLTELGNKADLLDVAKVKLDIARAQLGLGEQVTCWQEARPLVKTFIQKVNVISKPLKLVSCFICQSKTILLHCTWSCLLVSGDISC